MEVHFAPELEKKLAELAALTGREAHELVQELVVGILAENTELARIVSASIKTARTRGAVSSSNGN